MSNASMQQSVVSCRLVESTTPCCPQTCDASLHVSWIKDLTAQNCIIGGMINRGNTAHQVLEATCNSFQQSKSKNRHIRARGRCWQGGCSTEDNSGAAPRADSKPPIQLLPESCIVSTIIPTNTKSCIYSRELQ